MRRVGGVRRANRTMPKCKGSRSSRLHLVGDFPRPSATWNVKSLPGGLYLIQERQDGRVLRIPRRRGYARRALGDAPGATITAALAVGKRV